MRSAASPAQLLIDFGPEAAAERVAREVSLGGGRFKRVVFTQNRRVMASSADRGSTLRLHEVFLHAPTDVLRAIGQNFSTRRAAVRQASRAIIRDFLASAPIESPPAAPRPAPPPRKGDLPHLARLRSCFDAVNEEYFEGALPMVPLRLSGRMSRRLGHFCSEPLEIVISRSLCVRGEPGESEETLRHEMIHLWQWSVGRKPGHGSDFRRWAQRLGIHPRATRDVCWKQK